MPMAIDDSSKRTVLLGIWMLATCFAQQPSVAAIDVAELERWHDRVHGAWKSLDAGFSYTGTSRQTDYLIATPPVAENDQPRLSVRTTPRESSQHVSYWGDVGRFYLQSDNGAGVVTAWQGTAGHMYRITDSDKARRHSDRTAVASSDLPVEFFDPRGAAEKWFDFPFPASRAASNSKISSTVALTSASEVVSDSRLDYADSAGKPYFTRRRVTFTKSQDWWLPHLIEVTNETYAEPATVETIDWTLIPLNGVTVPIPTNRSVDWYTHVEGRRVQGKRRELAIDVASVASKPAVISEKWERINRAFPLDVPSLADTEAATLYESKFYLIPFFACIVVAGVLWRLRQSRSKQSSR
jgi:hypothetical protein